MLPAIGLGCTDRDVSYIVKCLPREVVVKRQLQRFTEYAMNLIESDQLLAVSRDSESSEPEFVVNIRTLFQVYMDNHFCEPSKCASLSFDFQGILRVSCVAGDRSSSYLSSWLFSNHLPSSFR